MRVQCCVCKKVKKNGAWRNASTVPSGVSASHTYCPKCLVEARREIHAERTRFLMAAQHSLTAAGL